MVPPKARLKVTTSLQFVAETLLPTTRGALRVRAYRDHEDGSEPLAIVHGTVEHGQDILLRVHDQCLTSEVFGSLKCDCADQLDYALNEIQRDGPGLVIYLPQEGRGIGLANKIAAYRLQESGLDTVDANRQLGLPDDIRRYDSAAEIIRDLSIESVRLLTNNPRKVRHLTKLGINISARLPLHIEPNPHSANYIATKFTRMDHMQDELASREMSSDSNHEETNEDT